MNFQSNDIGEIGNISKGLSTGLNNLISQKLGEVNRRKFAQQFQNTGYSPEVADLLATLNHQNPEQFHHNFKEINQQLKPAAAPGAVGANPTFEEKEAIKHRDTFLTGVTQKFNAAKNLGEKAQNALDFLDEHESDLPGNALTRKIFEDYPNWRNENASALNGMYEDIVADVAAYKASGGKTGRMTNALLQLAKNSKAAINQPIATQRILLNELIKTYDAARKEWEDLQDIKQSNNGQYPLDVQDKFINQSAGISKSPKTEEKTFIDKLPDPKEEDADAEFLSPKKDKVFFIKNKSWHSRPATKKDLERE